MVMAVAMAMSMPTALPARAQAASELPALGDAATLELSAQHERRLGELIMRQIRADPSTLDDPDTEEYLNHLGFTLVSVSPARHMDFEFFAVRDASLNAFALPGGFIGVHTGLVLAAETEAQLASVLAHEIGHVAQRHIARMLANERQSTAITLGTLLLALLAARSGSSSSGQLAQAALIGGQAACKISSIFPSMPNARPIASACNCSPMRTTIHAPLPIFSLACNVAPSFMTAPRPNTAAPTR
ncbi:MAG TPA: M48 family metalloprotease [Burkholderiaceae bacterium]|nr:M48 family metalloprotease [Burkholderiaceae bacterium]